MPSTVAEELDRDILLEGKFDVRFVGTEIELAMEVVMGP